VAVLTKMLVVENSPFFRFLEQEIAAMFDPPHLLQSTRNLFLKHEVMNVRLGVVVNGQQLTGTADMGRQTEAV